MWHCLGPSAMDGVVWVRGKIRIYKSCWFQAISKKISNANSCSTKQQWKRKGTSQHVWPLDQLQRSWLGLSQLTWIVHLQGVPSPWLKTPSRDQPSGHNSDVSQWTNQWPEYYVHSLVGWLNECMTLKDTTYMNRSDQEKGEDMPSCQTYVVFLSRMQVIK